jgi:alpha/beta hydrolase family protein DUF900
MFSSTHAQSRGYFSCQRSNPAPTSRNIRGYPHDENEVDTASWHFANLLLELHERMPLVEIDIIAHSMGNRVVLGALQTLPLRIVHVDLLPGRLVHKNAEQSQPGSKKPPRLSGASRHPDKVLRHGGVCMCHLPEPPTPTAERSRSDAAAGRW